MNALAMWKDTLYSGSEDTEIKVSVGNVCPNHRNHMLSVFCVSATLHRPVCMYKHNRYTVCVCVLYNVHSTY